MKERGRLGSHLVVLKSTPAFVLRDHSRGGTLGPYGILGIEPRSSLWKTSVFLTVLFYFWSLTPFLVLGLFFCHTCGIQDLLWFCT